ncbi:MAG TPA: hemerythrin domain-containing protein [Rhodanobacteraceae bacterium]
MRVLSKWFGKGSKSPASDRIGVDFAATGAPYAPGTRIAYDAELITRFEGHHKSLLKLFDNLSRLADERAYDRLGPALKKFLNVLQQHVLEENLKLYVYLEKCIDDGDHAQMMHEMKLEMGQIGRRVRAFVRHHIEFAVNADNIVKFRQELKEIGAVLVDRIQREEDGLYKLYMPPRHYEQA